mmetsp:Transcript_98185/g.184649  ORF Transcript_98185/g.184649 Transcript_98185/m.184649 type:complete len:351 (-) Transcript_98185:33-1085(-)
MGVRISSEGIDCCLPAAGADEVQIGPRRTGPPGMSIDSKGGQPQFIGSERREGTLIIRPEDPGASSPSVAQSPLYDSPERPQQSLTPDKLSKSPTATSQESWEARLEMVQALGESTDPQEAPQACSSLRTILRLDPAWQVRRQAAHSLRCLGYSAVRDAESELRSRLQDTESGVRAAAALALQVHGFELDGLPTSEPSNGANPQEEVECTESETDVTGSLPIEVEGNALQNDYIKKSPSDGVHTEEDREPGVVSFTLDIDKAAFSADGPRKLGIDLDVTDSRFMQIIGVKEESLMAEWNARNPARQLLVGDKVVAVNSISHNSRGMVQEVVDAPKLKLHVQRLWPASDVS